MTTTKKTECYKKLLELDRSTKKLLKLDRSTTASVVQIDIAIAEAWSGVKEL